jgi:hypothetical protein
LYSEIISIGCPDNWNPENLSPFDAGPEGLVIQSDYVVMTFKYTMVDNIKVYEIEVKVPHADFYINCEIKRQEKDYDSFLWVTPFDNTKQSYFSKLINIALPAKIEYTLEGKTIKCEDNCLVTIESFRSHFKYGVIYKHALLQTKLPDGRTFGLNLADGLNARFFEYF